MSHTPVPLDWPSSEMLLEPVSPMGIGLEMFPYVMVSQYTVVPVCLPNSLSVRAQVSALV